MEGLGHIAQTLHQLKTGVLRSPQRGKDFERYEANALIERSRLNVFGTWMRSSDCLDLQKLAALCACPGRGMLKESSPNAIAPCRGVHCHANDLEGL